MQTPAKCSIFLLLLLLTKWVCANEEVTLFLPLLPRASLVASVIGGDSTVATYAIECSQVRGVFCAIPQNLTLTEGPSTACYTVTQAGVTRSLNCQVSGTTSADCSGGQVVKGSTTPTSTSFPSALMEAFYQPVLLTGCPTTGASASAGTAHVTTTVTGATTALSSITTTGVSTSTAVSSVPTVTRFSAAGVRRVTGGQQLVLGGAGVALAAIAL